jgi:phosphoglycolate phosphatase-like HAD superfamily hydrolase
VKPTVFLWDIDGTLMSSSGAGRRSIEKTFAARFGRHDVLDFPFDGMTDPVIFRRGLQGVGLDEAAADAALAEVVDAYLHHLGEACASPVGFRVHDGVSDCLDQLAGKPGVAVGLGTGNVERGARIKLGRVNLNHHFGFGGFGSDHGDRAALLAVGAERGAARLGQPRSACRVVVIGDTPKDIAAARAIGADCIAVATGSYRAADLAQHRPTAVAETLCDAAARAALMGDAA